MSRATMMKHLLAVAILTLSQFTAFPFLAIVVTNTARHGWAESMDPSNVTIVYKSKGGRNLGTL